MPTHSLLSAQDLMRQAHMTADVYLLKAVDTIDGKFGEGYAAKHPELVAAYMQVCVQDYTTGMYANESSEFRCILVEISGTLSGLKSSAGKETFEDYTQSL